MSLSKLLQPERSDRAEILDDLSSSVSREELHGNLRDIRRSNRFFGGTAPVVSAVRRICRGRQCNSLLDIATGSADIPLAIVQQAEHGGWGMRVVATDIDPQILAVAEVSARLGQLRVEQADALALPYEPDSFDIVTLSLALHHFSPDDAVTVLSEMRRVAARAMIVSDLARSWSGFAGALLFANLLTRNRLTRHDAPLSVRRAYTPNEALDMASTAGWRATSVKSVAPFRFILVGRP